MLFPLSLLLLQSFCGKIILITYSLNTIITNLGSDWMVSWEGNFTWMEMLTHYLSGPITAKQGAV